MSKMQREPFAEFAKLGVGIPRLTYQKNRTTAHVHWHDGSMHHYIEFSSALDKEGMGKALHGLFKRHMADINRRTKLGYGGVGGCLVYGPIPFALEVRELVLDHYTRALDIVATRIREHRTYLDELVANNGVEPRRQHDRHQV
jgi:hypothetical protein